MEPQQIIALIAIGICCLPLLIASFVATFMCVYEAHKYHEDSEDRKKRNK